MDVLYPHDHPGGHRSLLDPPRRLSAWSSVPVIAQRTHKRWVSAIAAAGVVVRIQQLVLQGLSVYVPLVTRHVPVPSGRLSAER